ncbi:MAG: cysteine--tRNA ligase, partial [Spirochaetes bacterium]
LSTLKEKGYDPLDYRYFCLGAHYRSQLQFGFEAMDSAKSGRRGLMDRVARIREEFQKQAEKKADFADVEKANNYLKSFEENISQDLNVPKALAALWNITKDSSIPASAKYPVILRMDRVLGLKLDTAELEKVDLSNDIKALVEEREQARKKKDYKRADEIRNILSERGIILEDTPQGVKWRKK